MLPLEKFDVDVAELLEHKDSILLELSNNNVLGASWVSENKILINDKGTEISI